MNAQSLERRAPLFARLDFVEATGLATGAQAVHSAAWQGDPTTLVLPLGAISLAAINSAIWALDSLRDQIWVLAQSPNRRSLYGVNDFCTGAVADAKKLGFSIKVSSLDGSTWPEVWASPSPAVEIAHAKAFGAAAREPLAAAFASRCLELLRSADSTLAPFLDLPANPPPPLGWLRRGPGFAAAVGRLWERREIESQAAQGAAPNRRSSL